MAKKQWKAAVKKTRDLKDPWENLGFEDLPEISVKRHVYNSRSKQWWEDDIVIKMEQKSFARGAMRECYRMKKLSKFSSQPDWNHASNYVAKRYMQEQPRSVYEDDVQLQMDSKLWGEKYSGRNPPKKVDFCQAYLIELRNSDGVSIVYCVEHFIDGEYIKYNSNSGFVTDLNRLTPQSFSHFTFEDSNHQSIVVDIQGVGDLYTDPQMHTVDLSNYGDANLGAKGMALFFSSHLCSPLCTTLGLTQFDLSSQEMERLMSQKWRITSSKTVVNPSNNALPIVTESVESVSEAFCRLRVSIDFSIHDTCELVESPLLTPKGLPLNCDFNGIKVDQVIEKEEDEAIKELDDEPVNQNKLHVHVPGSGRSASVVKETELLHVNGMMQIRQKLHNIGLVHYELCLYHLLGRFTDMTPDLESAMFHLKKAGDCSHPKALYLLGCIYQQRPHLQLEQLTVETSSINNYTGFTYFLNAAECGLRVAMVIVGQVYEMGGENIPSPDCDTEDKPITQDWCDAAKWYLDAIEAPQCEVDDLATDQENYTLLAKVAYLHQTGGFGLHIDYQKAGDYYQQAGDLAMESMKGKLATKYYMTAEECWSNITDE